MTGFYRGVNSWHNTENVWSQGWESQYNFSICCTCLFLCFVDFHNNFILYSSGNSTKEKWSASHCTCEWKRSEKTASHENVHLRRGSLLCMFYPCHYYCLAVRKGTGKIMFVTQSMATTWRDDQPFKYGKSSNLFHLCRKLPAWPERILWFVSDEMLEEKTKHWL